MAVRVVIPTNRELEWQGEWLISTSYVPGDVVARSGSTYRAVETTTGEDPLSTPLKWELVAQKGSAGAPGPSGDPGPAGAPGPTGPPGASYTQSIVSENHLEIVHGLNAYPEVAFKEDLGLGNTAWVNVQPEYISVNEFHVDFVKPRTGTLIWRL